MLVAVEFVIALPDDLPVLAVGVPYSPYDGYSPSGCNAGGY